MIRLLALAAATLMTSACGAWVTKYDMESNAMIRADILPESREQIISALEKLSEKHQFQIIVQRKDEHAPMAFNIMMRDNRFSVDPTNLPRPRLLQVAFFKARNPDIRPSDEELQSLVQEFSLSLDALDGVEVTSAELTP
jgi:hypothetical protein